MTDIVERLDGTICYASTNKEWPNVILQEAADIITRLRAEVERHRAALEKTTALAHANLRIQAGELTGEIMQVSINAREIFEEARAALEDGK